MQNENLNRNRIFAVRFTGKEFSEIEKRFKRTTCRKMSEYLRNCLLNKPVITKHRDASLDDFMLEFIGLRKELSALGNNFKQSVKKLHTLRQIPEFREWILNTQSQRERILFQTAVIEKIMQKTAEKWLQS